MGALSIWHWLIVLLVVLLVFGTKKLRNLGSDLGGAVKGFKDGMKTNDASAPEPTVTAQVAQDRSAAEKTTVDVEAKVKS